jgi:hypothetical protein
MKLTAFVLGMILCLTWTGCAKEPQEVIDGIMKEYGLLVTGLGPEISCEDATKSTLKLYDSGIDNQRKVLEDYNALSRDNKIKVTEELTKQGGALNKQYWAPFKDRCPTHAPQVGKILGGFLRRFGVE